MRFAIATAVVLATLPARADTVTRHNILFQGKAGGAQTTPTDGVNLLPYLTGAQTGPIHEAMYWRMGLDGFAIREGDWKLAKGRSGSRIELYHLNPDGTGEFTDVAAANPEKFQELVRDFVAWEATVDKLKWTNAVNVNRFDEFVQRIYLFFLAGRPA